MSNIRLGSKSEINIYACITKRKSENQRWNFARMGALKSQSASRKRDKVPRAGVRYLYKNSGGWGSVSGIIQMGNLYAFLTVFGIMSAVSKPI